MFKKASKDAWAVVKKSNMFMLAIGLLIGTAFNAVVQSLAKDVIMPPISQLMGSSDVENWQIGSVLIGKFLSALLAFIIITFVIYLMLMVVFLIKASIDFRKLLKLKKEDKPEPIVEPDTDQLILLELQKLNQHFAKHEQNQQ
ncbi:MscL family protein [Mycoplasma simbae]|uniref:MscL family protein n=1 Tax=Mycoplasma simbae TaxID=36744 RepID=UPI000497AF3E|nr:MscL family protein [Mycoplasma simbae]